MAWLILVGPIRRDRRLEDQLDFHIDSLILDWARLLNLHDEDTKTCDICGVSHLSPVWIETMSQVYSLDDLRSIPWYDNCNCFDSFLAASAHSGEHRPLRKDSAVLCVLYELVVPLWPLILWVAFRTMMNDQTDVLQIFLDSLNTISLDQNLFIWDDNDDADLGLVVMKDTDLLGLYPQDWNQYMVEIDLETWVQITRMTWIAREDNPHPRFTDDLMSRITTLFIRWPSSPTAFFQNIVAPLDLSFDQFLFAFMVHVVDENYKERSTPADFKSEEFWTTQNLEDWLSARSEILCCAAWQTSSSILERVQAKDLILHTLSQFGDNWEVDFHLAPDIGVGLRFLLESLTSYYLKMLLGLAKKSVTEKDPSGSINHTISTDIYEHMNRDISIVVARLVLLLRDSDSYKTLLYLTPYLAT
ncbi:hypothetical protein B0H13DRAFT_2373054 [Mycena leptocephala]|nr:hypothetical protein B0H13DRAFT_2373054 [Mycena leptocephala]